MELVMIQNRDGDGWHKIATYTRADAEKLIVSDDYRRALIRAGFPENVELRIVPID